MSKLVNYVLTDKSVVLVFEDKPIPVASENPMYSQIRKALKLGQTEKLEEMLDISKKLVKHSSGRFYMKDGEVFADGAVMPSTLSKRVLSFADAGLPVEPLIKFWENLNQNPTKDSRNELFAFLEVNHVPLTEDGCFIAYKKIRGDFKDIFSGTIDNSVGAKPNVSRDSVDPNRNNTCSRGLHVAAFNYAKYSYGSQNEPLVLVKVNPKYVVTVPPDYHEQKMRVCEYEVLEVFDGNNPLTQELYGHNLEEAKATGDDWEDFDQSVEEDLEQEYVSSEELDSEETDGSADVEAELVVDDEGRVRVPSSVIKNMAMEPGDTLFVTVEDGFLLLNPDFPNVDGHEYTVDSRYNVRISGKVLKEAGLNKRKKLTVLSWEDESEIN
jgi:bifunctional DNA-binding transcriptional regulator/antitoxin component of YhaV-PrlF toxin-antitoxin module